MPSTTPKTTAATTKPAVDQPALRIETVSVPRCSTNRSSSSSATNTATRATHAASVTSMSAGSHPAHAVWAREDSNLRPTDYESAALTAELLARVRTASSLGGPRLVGREAPSVVAPGRRARLGVGCDELGL